MTPFDPLAAPTSCSVEILVVGAGPQALAVTTHLLTAAPSLRGAIAVVDPAGTWMHTWHEQFTRLDIDTLRSPGVHSPDPDPSALFEHISRHRLGSPGLPYAVPFTSAFRSFCDHLVERCRLEELVQRGVVSSIDLPAPQSAATPDSITVTTSTAAAGRTTAETTPITARHVVVCANPSTPRIPDWAASAIGEGIDAVVHATDVDLRELDSLAGEHVAVVGGGLTAAHLATAALRRGAQVTMIVRRTLRESDFDIDAGWLGPRFLDGFDAEPDPRVRAASVVAARDGGSITPVMLRQLRSAVADGSLTLLERADVIDLHVGALRPADLRIDVAVEQQAERREVRADRCWLATGSAPSLDAVPAFADLAEHCRIVDGLPVLTPDLRIGALPLHVTGRLASLRLGPAAGNLWGARRAAQAITRAITGIDLATDLGATRTATTRTAPARTATARAMSRAMSSTLRHGGAGSIPTTKPTTKPVHTTTPVHTTRPTMTTPVPATTHTTETATTAATTPGPTPGPGHAARSLPTTVVSGFLGAGKTTVLNRLLQNREGRRLAVIVNDMSEINVDASLVAGQVRLDRTEERLVEMTNGCICCTLRDDLLDEVARLADEGRFDHLVIESTGISEPMPVAATFLFDTGDEHSLLDRAHIDSMTTVVDAERLLEHFDEVAELAELGIGRDQGDDRTIADLIVDQIEFADLLVVSKADLVDADELARVCALVRALNPDAEIITALHGDVPIDRLLGTGRFDPDTTGAFPGWAQALNGAAVPESEEYGIASFVYRSRRPFHPARLAATLEGDRWDGVLRSKGFFWLATRPDVQAIWHQAGTSIVLEPSAPWLAAVPQDSWDLDDDERADVERRWDPEFGDRMTELVFIGIDMDEAAITAALDHCALTDKETSKGARRWARFADPLPAWDTDD